MKRFVFGILISVLFLGSCQPNNYGAKYKFEKFEVFYQESAISEKQVEDLHEYFKKNDLLTGKPQSVQLTKNDDNVVLKLVQSDAKSNIQLLPEYREAIQKIAKEISEEIFDGEYVELHLASNTFKTIEIIA